MSRLPLVHKANYIVFCVGRGGAWGRAVNPIRQQALFPGSRYSLRVINSINVCTNTENWTGKYKFPNFVFVKNTTFRKGEAASNIQGNCHLIRIDMGVMGSRLPCLLE